MTQDTLFEVATAPSAPPPNGTVPPASVEPCQPCVKCGEPASLVLPNGKYIYCANCGKCARKYITETALGIQVTVCNRSVETFVVHKRLGIYVCSCMQGSEIKI